MRPPEITRYIALIVKEDPDIELAKSWYQCVKSRAPHGVIDTVEASDDQGSKQAAMVKRKEDDTYFLMIPLTRDLLEDEASRIIATFTADHPDTDFDIEATVVKTGENGAPPPSINIDQERYIELCTSLSKKQHEDWVRSRTAEGWRYGPQLNMIEKTHPLLRTWDQLPDRYQTIDLEQPQRLIDLLTQHGYAVVSKDDLNELFKHTRR